MRERAALALECVFAQLRWKTRRLLELRNETAEPLFTPAPGPLPNPAPDARVKIWGIRVVAVLGRPTRVGLPSDEGQRSDCDDDDDPPTGWRQCRPFATYNRTGTSTVPGYQVPVKGFRTYSVPRYSPENRYGYRYDCMIQLRIARTGTNWYFSCVRR